MWLAIVLGFGLAGSLVLLGIVSLSSLPFSESFAHGGRSGSDLHEEVLREGDHGDRIAVIDVEGVITGQHIESIGRTFVELVRDQLERAEEDGVKAVLLKVDSPGGEVLASDEIYLLIEQFQKRNPRIPVVASMGSLAASGGYYVSAPCRWIVANELTMTGSIGVIFHSYNYRGLMEKVGVRPDITKSGKLKDMMSGEKLPEEILPEEKRIMQNLIDESFAKFKSVVRDGRRNAAERNRKEKVEEGRELVANWQEYADGRILSGTEAQKIGLVDEIGNFDVAVERAESLAGLEEGSAQLVRYLPPMRFPGLFSLFSHSEARPVKVDLGLPFPTSLPQGRLYFISPVHLH